LVETLDRSHLRDRDLSSSHRDDEGSSLADHLPGKSSHRDELPEKSSYRDDFQPRSRRDRSHIVKLEDCFNLLGGGDPNQFWKKLAVYVKTITGSNLRYSFDSLGVNESGEIFLTLEIKKPTHYWKGVKLSDLLDFYGKKLPVKFRPGSLSGGGGGVSKSARRADGEPRLRGSAPAVYGGGAGG